MKEITIEIIFKVAIGTCLYNHDPSLSAAYGLFILFQLWQDYRDRMKKQELADELIELITEQDLNAELETLTGSESVSELLDSADKGKPQ